MTIGEKIKALRQDRGLSQEALAEQLQVSRQAVSKWEKGLSYPTTENLLTLAALFSVSADQLVSTQNSDKAARAEPPHPQHRPLVIAGLLVLLAVLVGLGLWQGNREEAPRTVPGEAGDFALCWTADGKTEFLALGWQPEHFPFGKSLAPTEQESVQSTDFGQAVQVHQVACGSLSLTYSRVQDDDREEARDYVDRMTTITADISTPRGIHPGSTAQEVLSAYDGQLVYGVKSDGPDLLCTHECIYIYSPEGCSTGILFYMEQDRVNGIAVESGSDMGHDAFAVNQQSIFPMQDGQPDFGEQLTPEKEPLDADRTVYVALSALTNSQNLSAEERYDCTNEIYNNLAYLDWDAYGRLGEAGKEDETRSELLSWLRQERSLSSTDLRGLLLGAVRSNLDGWYADSYTAALASAYCAYPESLLDCMGQEAVFSPEEREMLVHLTAYGLTETEESRKQALDLTRPLESRHNFLDAGHDCWKQLLTLLEGPDSLSA